MPGYTCSLKELLKMISKDEISLDNLEYYLDCVKSEFKGYDEQKDELKLENNDTNRPDLWSLEGTARQILSVHFNERKDYDFFGKTPESKHKIIVSEEVASIRPFIAGFAVSDIEVSDSFLEQIIQAQEKLCDNFGRKRELIAIGVYDAGQIAFPIHYKAAILDDVAFSPLGFEEKMTLREILSKHPKGIQYGFILTGSDAAPILYDDNGSVLSFPPIINSNDLGRVKVGDKRLFVEVTGTDKEAVNLAANIMAVNIADHGGVIYPFAVEYSSMTDVSPKIFNCETEITCEFAEKISGMKVSVDDLAGYLERMGHKVRISGNSAICLPPPYRGDVMHMSDLAEDYCIAFGYNNFEPEMLDSFTVGTESDKALFEKKIRELMVGMSFQEVMTYILTSAENQRDKMRDFSDILEIANPMTETFGAVRRSLIPILLEIESKNPRAEYPHRIFETGEVALPCEESPERSVTLYKVAALITHGTSNFSEISSVLQSLMFYLNWDYSLIPFEHPSFIPGRCGIIVSGGKRIGIIGEIHPETLENWSIAMPCACFELSF